MIAQTAKPLSEPSTEGRPDLSGLAVGETKAIEKACDSIKQFRGPGEFYQCLQHQLASLQRSGGRPDLSGATASEAKAIEKACDSIKQFRGPGEFYQCLQHQLASLQRSGGRPDLSGVTTNEAKIIENVCDSPKRFRGPGDYYQCLQHELAGLQRSGGRPDLSGVTTNEAKAIEKACDSVRQFRGPGDYYQCLQHQLATLQRSGGRPDISGVTAIEAKAIENACDSVKQFRGPGEYYQCLQHQLAALQKFLAATKGSRTAEEPQPGPLPLAQANVKAGDEAEEPLKTDVSVEKNKPTGLEAKEQVANIVLPDNPSTNVPRATHANQPTTYFATVLTVAAFSFTVLFFIGRVAFKRRIPVPFLMDRGIHSRIRLKRCLYCNSLTRNHQRICSVCKMLMHNAAANARVIESQDRELVTQTEGNNKGDEDGKVENQRWRNQGAPSSKPATDDDFNPYQILQLTRGANKEEIRAAYLELIKQYHPDKVSHLTKEFQSIAAEKTQAIIRAYALLTEN